MDVLVQIEARPAHSLVLAHVNSVSAPRTSERLSRDVVTLYGAPSFEALALALAAVVESRDDVVGGPPTTRHFGIWPERGAVGDAAWHDEATGQLMTRELDIPLDRLREIAGQLLDECGKMLRPLLAGLAMPDWPEGAHRAINISLGPRPILAAMLGGDALLDLVREGDGTTYDHHEHEGD